MQSTMSFSSESKKLQHFSFHMQYASSTKTSPSIYYLNRSVPNSVWSVCRSHIGLFWVIGPVYSGKTITWSLRLQPLINSATLLDVSDTKKYYTGIWIWLHRYIMSNNGVKKTNKTFCYLIYQWSRPMPAHTFTQFRASNQHKHAFGLWRLWENTHTRKALWSDQDSNLLLWAIFTESTVSTSVKMIFLNPIIKKNVCSIKATNSFATSGAMIHPFAHILLL